MREGCPEAVARIGDRVEFLPPPNDIEMLIKGEPMLVPVLDPSDALWAAAHPERVAHIREFGLHSLIAVPMLARNTVLGVATFIRSLNPTAFQPDDVLLARELVAPAALCVDNARRYTREHTAAVTLQRSLLPQALTGGEALEVASHDPPGGTRSGGVGGDWFDVIPLSGARVGLVVGDVVGHGIGAAAAMGRLRTAVQTLADMELPPDELLAHLDDLVLRRATSGRGTRPPPRAPPPSWGRPACTPCTTPHPALLHGPGRTPAPGRGHPGQAGLLPRTPRRAAARAGRIAFEAGEIELPANSLLGLYTDGLIEGPDGDLRLGWPGSRTSSPGRARTWTDCAAPRCGG
ncbi:Magnesium or manganese-dependent protein phosphatase OS=Streptomyces glaucescens OX=1907 GN=SGLAU_29980 PE=4 SV=1 [Streptomyces glaucescens]